MSAKDLQRQLEEQKNQIVNYEKKLKDVVRAYKSLELEKKALEVALEAVGTASAPADGTTATPAAEPPPDADDETKIAALKQALSTLTIENKRKEMAFQSDRKALITKNEQLQAQLDKLKNVSDAVGIAKALKKGLKQAENDKERMLADHGAVLAEMQSRYAKEHTHAEQLERQLTEQYKNLAAAEQKLGKVKELEAQVAEWKTRAEGTPSVRVIREELENTKKAHAQELASLKAKYAARDNIRDDKDSRIVALEQRIRELTEESVATMQEKAELMSAMDQLEKKLNFLMKESDSLKKAQRRLSMEVEEGTTEERLIECYKQCIKEKPGFDIYEILKLPLPYFHNSERPASAVPPESQSDTDAPSHCHTCELAQKDLSYFKNLIGHLQKKLRTLESSHDLMKKDHENVTSSLRTRIADLETIQEQTYSQLTAECKRKVAELEDEMTKQRARLLETINEKEREIELTKQSLAAMYSNQVPDPVDPPQGKSPVGRKDSRNLRRSTDSLRSAKTYHSEDGDDLTVGSPGQVTRSLSAHLGENRNIFYEQELSRREHEIAELRHLIRLSETKVREIESATLTKDMQYLQIVETLKEEIRVLEGRLTLQKSEVNLEYLRNVFISFLNSENPKSRKHILKAIGAVLRLTPSEMRKIDAWSL
uniref:GRIP domain-containing protein n=1 Tax=Panagrellus redivivus TaxID=6233 RepID=A0A7E4VSW4_PANRE